MIRVALASIILTLSTHAEPAAAADSSPVNCADPGHEKSLLKPGPAAVNWTRKWRGIAPEKHVTQMKIADQTITVKSNKYLAATQPARSTVIFLCGGPGLACSQYGRPANVPPDVNVITFDYLGVGENASAKLSNEALSLESQASVVDGIVKSYKLKNYVLYGHSFGTTVATVAASRMSQVPNATKPQAVVLEGVVGPQPTMVQNAARARTAAQAWKQLGSVGQQKFRETFQTVWRESDESGRTQLNQDLQQALPNGPRTTLLALQNFIREPRSAEQAPPPEGRDLPTDPDQGPLTTIENSAAAIHEYRAAGCQIFPKRPAKDPYTYFGGLVRNRLGEDFTYTHLCACPLIDRPFDPAQHPIKNLPVLYVNSDMDPVTPMETAVKHYETQTQTEDKLFLNPKDGGHGDFIQGRLSNCAGVVWDAVLAGHLAPIQKNQASLEAGNCDALTTPTSTSASTAAPARIAR